jgi:hypothetical protein
MRRRFLSLASNDVAKLSAEVKRQSAQLQAQDVLLRKLAAAAHLPLTPPALPVEDAKPPPKLKSPRGFMDFSRKTEVRCFFMS